MAARRAYTLTLMGRNAAAFAEARRAARLSPENSGALMTLASILYVTGDVAGARAEFDTIRSRFQPDAEMERLRRLVYGEHPTARDSTRAMP